MLSRGHSLFESLKFDFEVVENDRNWMELSTEGIERSFLVRRELDGALAQRELDRT